MEVNCEALRAGSVEISSFDWLAPPAEILRCWGGKMMCSVGELRPFSLFAVENLAIWMHLLSNGFACFYFGMCELFACVNCAFVLAAFFLN